MLLRRRSTRALWCGLTALLPFCLGSFCEGQGANRPGAITQGPIDPRCSPVGGRFPSGFDLQAGSDDLALVMRFNPPGLLRFDLSTSPPMPANTAPVPTLTAQTGAGVPISSPGCPDLDPATPPLDSDGDGRDDALAFRAAGLCPSFNPCCLTWPIVGGLNPVHPDLTLVTASDYEAVIFYSPADGTLLGLEVENPSAGAEDRLLSPPAGSRAIRTALSTLTCVYPDVPIDSAGGAVPASPFCDPGRVGFLTSFTAATAWSEDVLFVATSNLRTPSIGLFDPGTVLVYDTETDASGRMTGVVPDTAGPALFTTAFNPTGLTPYTTRAGRSLVLVTNTGALNVTGESLSPSAIDVIDVAERRIVASFPLGLAGASFGKLAIDPGQRLAMVGAEGARALYAVDLRPLEDPSLYAPRPEPVRLDGTTPGFPDARIFDASAPFVLPTRPDGPPLAICPPRTNVALNHDGRFAYATDWCDGSISILRIDGTPPLEQPLARSRFSLTNRLDLFAPKTPRNVGLPNSPSLPRTRPGVPGVDYDGPDLFFLINDPEGQLCAARVEP